MLGPRRRAPPPPSSHASGDRRSRTTVLAIGMIVTLVILYVVVPRFAEAVADAGAEAPVIMRMMLGASHVPA